MASEKILQQKQAYVEELAEKLKNSVAGVIVSYMGITVADDTALRRKLREAGVEYAVVKNSMLRRAADKVGLDGLDNVLEGSTALALSPTDHVAAAKILSEYAEKSKTFEIKAGYVEGKVIDAAGVAELAKMPPKRGAGRQGSGRLERSDQRFCQCSQRQYPRPGGGAQRHRRKAERLTRSRN